MATAEEILFNKIHNGKCFYENKTELSNLLISSKNSSYYCSYENPINYAKSLNKIKAYLSQLFSYKTSRVVTDDFIGSLKGILIEREMFEKEYVEQQIELVKELLIKKNLLSSQKNALPFLKKKKISQNEITDIICKELNNSKYILIVASRPYEYLNSPYNNEKRIFDKIINLIVHAFKDLYKAIKTKLRPNSAKFSINVPKINMANRFWNELSDVLFERIGYDDQRELTLLCKSLNYGADDEYGDSFSDSTFNKYENPSDTILNYLDKHSIFQVYLNEFPIYSVPMIIFNPNYSPTSAYYFLEDSNHETEFFNLSPNGIETWKENVWDIVKSNPKGNKVSFQSAKK